MIQGKKKKRFGATGGAQETKGRTGGKENGTGAGEGEAISARGRAVVVCGKKSSVMNF